MSYLTKFLEENKPDDFLGTIVAEIFPAEAPPNSTQPAVQVPPPIASESSSHPNPIQFRFKQTPEEEKVAIAFEKASQNYSWIKEISEFLEQSPVTKATATGLSEEVRGKVAAIAERSQALETERAALEHLKMELQSSLVHFMGRAEFNQRIDFLESLKRLEQFAVVHPQLSETISRVSVGWSFFHNRPNFLEYGAQFDMCQHLSQQIQKAAGAIGNDFLGLFSGRLKANKQKIAAAYTKSLKTVPGLGSNWALVVLFAPDLTQGCLTGRIQPLSQDFQNLVVTFQGIFGEDPSSWEAFKVLWSQSMSQTLYEGAFINFQGAFLRAIFSSLSDLQEEIAKELDLSGLFDLFEHILAVGLVSCLSFFGKTPYLEKETIQVSQTALIKPAAQLLQRKIKNETDFELMVAFYRRSQAFRENRDYKKDSGNLQATLQRLSELDEFSLFPDFDQHLASTFDTIRGLLFVAIFEVLDFQVEYMVQRVCNQTFLNDNRQKELDSFDQTAAAVQAGAGEPLVAYSVRVLWYLLSALDKISDAQNDVGKFKKRVSVLTAKRIISLSLSIRQPEKAFLFALQNLAQIFSQARSKQSLEVLFEYTDVSSSVGAVFAADENDPEKFSYENIAYFLAGLVNALVNSEIKSFEVIFGDVSGLPDIALAKISEKLKSKLQLYADFMEKTTGPATKDLLQAIFFPNAMIFVTQSAMARGLGESGTLQLQKAVPPGLQSLAPNIPDSA